MLFAPFRFVTEFVKELEKESGFNLASKLIESIYDIEADLKNFVDSQGDTLIHLVVKSLVKKLTDMYAPYKFKKSLPCNDPVYEKENSLSEAVAMLLKKMLDLCFIFHIKNFAGEYPIDLIWQVEINNFNKIAITQRLLSLFEAYSVLYPGRKYVFDLTLVRSSKHPEKVCQIPDFDTITAKKDGSHLTLHQRLAFYEKYLFLTKCSNNAKNLVVAYLGLVISDKPKSNNDHKRIFVTFPVLFNNLIVSALKPANGRTHSESQLSEILKNQVFLTAFFTNLLKLGFNEGHKIYALILDIHSTLEVCYDCQDELHRLQVNDDITGFLNILNTNAAQLGFVMPSKSKLTLTIRASGMGNPVLESIKANVFPPVYSINLSRDIKTHPASLLLHLPPSWYGSCSFATGYLNPFCNEALREYKQNLRSTAGKLASSIAEHLPNITAEYNLQMEQEKINAIPYNSFIFYWQTAFSNTGGKAYNFENYPNRLEEEVNIGTSESHVSKSLNYAFLI